MKLNGCHVAIVTPFTDAGTVDEAGLRKNIAFLKKNGVAGIVPCGTTGESATLSWEEHLRVVDIAIEEAGGEVTVIAGAGSNNTAESIRAAAHAKEAGADAILCITPYYNKPSQEGLFRHYRSIVTEVDIPVVLYNVPGRRGVSMQPGTIERLCAFDSIVAIKEASGSLDQVSEIHRRCKDRLTILSGDDGLTLPILCCGGSGVISVAANLVPERLVAMIDAWDRGDIGQARSIHESLLPLFGALFIETNPVPVKTAMDAAGQAAGPLRLPLAPLAEQNKTRLLDVLSQSGIL